MSDDTPKTPDVPETPDATEAADASETPGTAETSPAPEAKEPTDSKPAVEPARGSGELEGGGSMFPALILLVACAVAVIAMLSMGKTEDSAASATPEQIAQYIDDAERLLQEERKPGEAVVFIERVLAADPDHVHANVLMGAALISVDQTKDALVYLDHAEELAPEDLSVLRHRALALQNLQDWAQARAVWQKVLKIVDEQGGDPTSALFQLATNYLFQGELNRATEHLERYLKLKPDNAIAHQMHSDALGGLGRNSESIAAMESVVAILPSHVPTRHGLQTKRLKFLGFDATLKLHADRAAAADALPVDHYLYARLLVRKPGESAASREEYEAALAGQPELYWALEGLAQLDLRAGDAERAQDRCKLAIELASQQKQPDPFFAGRVRLAAAERALGSHAAALKTLQPLLDQSGYSFTAAIEYLGTLLDSGQSDKAIEFALQQTAGKPAATQETMLLAVAYRGVGDPAKQREVLETALAEQPKGTGWQFQLALLDLQEGKLESAQDRFERILEAHPEDKPLVPYLAFWAGYAVAETQPETALARWKRGRSRPRVWPDAFWGDACGHALGEVDAETLAASLELEGLGERNHGPFVEGFVLERNGDPEGAKARYKQVVGNARHQGNEWPAGLAQARLTALGE